MPDRPAANTPAGYSSRGAVRSDRHSTMTGYSTRTVQAARRQRRDDERGHPGLCDHRYFPGGFRRQGNRAGGSRNAGPDDNARGVCRGPAPEGRPDCRLAPHDDPDGGADPDAGGAGRRCPLGDLQYLFDPGSRRRHHCRQRHAGLRGQGRNAGGILGLCPPHFRLGRRWRAEHDPGRWRRRHAAGPSRQEGGERTFRPRRSAE